MLPSIAHYCCNCFKRNKDKEKDYKCNEERLNNLSLNNPQTVHSGSKTYIKTVLIFIHKMILCGYII